MGNNAGCCNNSSDVRANVDTRSISESLRRNTEEIIDDDFPTNGQISYEPFLPDISNMHNENLPDSSYAKLIPEMPPKHEKVKEVMEKLGEFKYNADESEFQGLSYGGPYEINGSYYTGQWLNGARHGRGVQIFKDGSIYEGYWKNNVPNGRGRLIFVNGEVYDGNYMNDKPHGTGTFYYVNDERVKYEGDWVEGQPEGTGQQTWRDGSVYSGDFKGGKMHGWGEFKWADGSKYEGTFENGNMDGKGTMEWPGRKKVYNGEWKNNRMEGTGTLITEDRKRYEGQFLNDEKHGFGTLEWPDGRKYHGNWQNGKYHGRGFFTKDGVEKEGEWNEGTLVAWI